MRVDQICIFQEWHFNGIKTEMKEIYVYSLVSVTDCDLLLKYNILLAARFLSAIEYNEWNVISSQPWQSATMWKMKTVQRLSRQICHQSFSSVQSIWQTANRSRCLAVCVLIKLLEPVTKTPQQAKRGQNINKKHFNLLMTAFRIYWMFFIVAGSIVESGRWSSPVASF